MRKRSILDTMVVLIGACCGPRMAWFCRDQLLTLQEKLWEAGEWVYGPRKGAVTA